MVGDTQSQKPIERDRQSQKSNAMLLNEGMSSGVVQTDMDMGQSTHIKKEEQKNPPAVDEDDDIEMDIEADEDYSDNYDDDEYEN